MPQTAPAHAAARLRPRSAAPAGRRCGPRAHVSCAALPRSALRLRRAPPLRVHAAAQDSPEWERIIAAPRLEAGLDVHRRVHALAARNASYLFQWRAFCQRQARDWQASCSTEDEAVLAGACGCLLALVAACVSHR